MYQTGDKVVYGMHGVCRVTDIEHRVVDRKQVAYLVLEPVGQQASRFLLPVHNPVAMGKLHPLLDREALELLLDSEVVRTDAWIKEENQRKQCYRELIASGDRQRLLQMLRTLYRHRSAQNSSGKKLHMCDENFLRDAERLLVNEISVIMDADSDEARKYLRNKLKEDA